MWYTYLAIDLASNGLLTGSWIQEPVVWYNAAEIAGPRLMTIPWKILHMACR